MFNQCFANALFKFNSSYLICSPLMKIQWYENSFQIRTIEIMYVAPHDLTVNEYVVRSFIIMAIFLSIKLAVTPPCHTSARHMSS